MPLEQPSLEEIIQLGAVDGQFFMSTFFEKTARQEPAPFHADVWKKLSSNARFLNLQMFRGSAKTSLLRVFTARRISYNLSRTILYIGKSEGHAVRSINWIKNNIETNTKWAGTFGLKPGKKWQDTEANIKHDVDDDEIWIMGTGITGSVRGINRDDFRPDLIVLDDVIDDENALTQEQREKISTLIEGAVKESLAPRSECPDAKLVMLQTPIHLEDASCAALSDPQWLSAKYGCFTPETENLPIHQQQSAWPARWTSEELQKDKEAAIGRNKAHVWYREKEVKLVAPENAAFKPTWLKMYDDVQRPRFGVAVLVIDPVPPPSDREIEMGFTKKDYECLHVVQRAGNDYYSVEYAMNRGHDPSWTIANAFSLAKKYNVRMIMVESVAYQRTLAWLMRKAMENEGRFWQVREFTDSRSKFNKIVDSLNGVASEGHLFVKPNMSDLITQFRDYPKVAHDDVVETLALGVMELSGAAYTEELLGADAVMDLDNDEYAELDMSAMLGAP